jgi:hypothetical protein
MSNDIITYKLSEGNKKLSPHFRLSELACRDGSDIVKVSPETIRRLECIRKHYGFPVTINSGYRTAKYNRRIGGAKNSRHVVGDAADFVVRIPNGGIVDPLQVYRDIDGGKIAGIDPKKIGLGRYRSFTHIDSRNYKSRWIG